LPADDVGIFAIDAEPRFLSGVVLIVTLHFVTVAQRWAMRFTT
jgi:hypothetical protein